MNSWDGMAGYIAAWRPSSVPPQAAAFARQVVTAGGAGRPGPGEEPAVGGGQAGRLRRSRSGWSRSPEVLLHPSVIERFAAHAPGLSGPARRTLRTNLRFIARAVVPQLDPADAPLPRERAKAPYTAGGDRRLPRAGRRPAHRRRGGCAPPGWSAWAPAPG